MYKYIIRKKLTAAFEQVNQGDYEPVLKQFLPDAEHWFSGEHALGQARHTPEGIRKWYERLKIVLPNLRFKILDIAVSGWPWDTLAVVEWRDSFFIPNGEARPNGGVHVFKLRWGKVSSLHIYCDTLKLAKTLELMSGQGIAEALAKPITD